MKVILTQELKGRGGEGDVIDVAHGFAVNYLLPRGIAIQATPGNLKQLEQRKHNITKREESRLGDASAFTSSLEGKKVVIEMKVGEEGRLFGSVTAPLIAEAIASQLGVEVDRRKIETYGVIKEMGEHTIGISVYRDIKASLTVDVVAEKSEDEIVARASAKSAPEAEVSVEEAPEVAEEAVEEAAPVAEEASAPTEETPEA